MHHVALDRAGPHDRHLHDEVVEARRPEPRQHVHLRPALDLEHPEAVGAPEHRVGLVAVARERSQVEVRAAVLAQQVEGAAQAGQHAEPQHIDLEDAERVDVVLVPFEHRAAVHRRVADHREFDQRPAGDDEAADVGGEVAGEALEFLRELQRNRQAAFGAAQPLAFGDLRQRPLPARPPRRLGELGRDVLRQAHRLADLADGAAGAEADHGGGDGGAVAAVAGVDVLDHLLAPLVLEIDVDVGRLAAVGGDEALEQQVVLRRVHRRDAEHVADRAVRGRAPALAEDAARAGERDDLVDGEEVGRVAEAFDQGEFVREAGADVVRARPRASAPPRRPRPWPLGSAAGCGRAPASRPGTRSEAGRARSRMRLQAPGACSPAPPGSGRTAAPSRRAA